MEPNLGNRYVVNVFSPMQLEICKLLLAVIIWTLAWWHLHFLKIKEVVTQNMKENNIQGPGEDGNISSV